MTDQELKDLVASIAVAQLKTDEQLKKTDEQLQKTDEQLQKMSEDINKLEEVQNRTDKKLDKIAKLVGNVSNNQGDVTEEYFVNSLTETLKIGEINFDYLIKNFVARNKRRKLAEYDILLVNGEKVAIIEVKYKAHLNDLDKLPKKIEELKNLPQYKNYKVYAGIATFYATDDLIEKAKELGHFILQRKGDMVITHSDNLQSA